jgi:DNA anti-recombination protein RmuC
MQRNMCKSGDSFRTSINECSEKDYILMLENELQRLRESTKQALHQSWDEVELLQEELSEHLELSAQVEADLVKSRENEEYWRKRCLEAERLAGLEQADPAPMKFLRKLSSTISNRSIIVDDTTESELLQEKEEVIEDLEKTIKDRDENIVALQCEVVKHRQTVTSMESEVRCMIETQRLRLQHQNTQVQVLESRLEKKDMHARELDRKLVVYKNYVDELASEIENTISLAQSHDEIDSAVSRNCHSLQSIKFPDIKPAQSYEYCVQ